MVAGGKGVAHRVQMSWRPDRYSKRDYPQHISEHRGGSQKTYMKHGTHKLHRLWVFFCSLALYVSPFLSGPCSTIIERR